MKGNFIEILHKHGVANDELLGWSDEPYYVFLNIYYNQVVDDAVARKFESAMKHISVIEELFAQKDDIAINAMETDLFVDLKEALGLRNYIVDKFSPSLLKACMDANHYFDNLNQNNG